MPATATHALPIAIVSMASLMFATSCGSETGPEAGALSFSAPAYEFGDVITGSSASREITVTNQQGRATGTIAVSLSGADNGEFGLHDDHCTGSILEHGQSCRLLVRLRPTSPGQKEARLTARSGPLEATASLRGSGADGGLVLQATSHHFGAAGVATLGTPYQFVVRNVGVLRTGAIATEMAGPNGVAFAITGDTCKGVGLAAGLTCAVSVRFAPAAAGSMAGQLTISASPGGSVVAALTGLAGIAVPLAADPAERDFGTVRMGTVPQPAALAFRNTGSSATGPLSVRVTGPNAADFSAGTGHNCVGVTLGAGQECAVNVGFSPRGRGARSAAYELTDAFGASSVVALSGIGEDVRLEVSIPSPVFPETAVGSATEQIVSMTNHGSMATDAISLSIQQCNYYYNCAPHFQVGADACTGTALAPGATCTVAVTFRPQWADFLYGQLDVVEHGEHHSVSFSGVGVTSVLDLSTSSLTFGATAVGASSAAQEVTVINTSPHPSAPLAATIEICGYYPYDCAPSSTFVVSASTCVAAVLAPGERCNLSVAFRPRIAGFDTASLRVTDGPRSYWVALSGTGVAP